MSPDRINGSDTEITLGLLKAVEASESLTQRGAASELGVALGLVNTYFKRCIKKGLIKVKHVPTNRYAYYLTPRGFAEKSRLTAEFLSQSLSLFRQAQHDYSEVLERCQVRGHRRLGLCGVSDLCEILALYARDYPVTLVGVVDPAHAGERFMDLTVAASPADLGEVDGYVLTDLGDPQKSYDWLAEAWPAARIYVPRLLEVQERPAE